MNILIPHEWLLEYLETNATPTEIQKYLSLCGPSIERIYEKEGEPVYDIEVTTNRVDCMSVQGIAREAAVILKQFGKKAKLKNVTFQKMEKLKKTYVSLPLPQIIDNQKLCKRTMAVALANVERTPTPEWMAKRLRQIDANVHDAVIDITNYITHELGHPCHAFDYDKVMELGGMIVVTLAKKGQKFTTLDEVEYTTVGGEVVFENGHGVIIDLPGIKGMLNTSINPETKNVLFWLEGNDASKIRFASMTHAIRTVAAQLNEKNVDPHLALPVMQKGIELFEELTHAQVASKIFDHFPNKKALPTVSVPLEKIQEYLGVELSITRIDQILEDLGCEVKLQRGKLLVTPPTFRADIEIPADVVEEIARIYGYHNLPSVLMPTAIPLEKPTDTNFVVENNIKHFLADIGWQEVYTYSMVSKHIAEQSGFAVKEHLKIQNPLTDDRVYLRRSLIPSLVEIIQGNSVSNSLRSVFEIANIYPPVAGDLPDEALRLSLVSTKNYREVKGDFESLLQKFFVSKITFALQKKPTTTFVQAADIVIDKKMIGEIGVLPNNFIAIDMSVKQLLQVVHSHPAYQPAPKTSEIIEDLTFTLPEKIAIGELILGIEDISPFIHKVNLHDVYGQNFTFTLTYNNSQKNLTAEDVGPIRKEVATYLQNKWAAKLVGTLQ